ncbi:MAG: hypothetical protein QXI19_10460 [Candidatus Caldarchaeum sp.]
MNLDIPVLTKEEKENPPPQEITEPKTEKEVQAPPHDPFQDIYGHDMFWRHFNDALEPAHGAMIPMMLQAPQPQQAPGASQGGISNATSEAGTPSQDKATNSEAEAGIISKYWPWLVIGGVGVLVITVTFLYFRKRRDDEGGDFRRKPEEEPPQPPPPPRSTNPIDEYLPFGR